VKVKLTCRSEYALLALVYLARHQKEEYISVQTIATAQQIPSKFLEQILLTLKLAKYLNSSKGKNGGFRLAKPLTRSLWPKSPGFSMARWRLRNQSANTSIRLHPLRKKEDCWPCSRRCGTALRLRWKIRRWPMYPKISTQSTERDRWELQGTERGRWGDAAMVLPPCPRVPAFHRSSPRPSRNIYNLVNPLTGLSRKLCREFFVMAGFC